MMDQTVTSHPAVQDARGLNQALDAALVRQAPQEFVRLVYAVDALKARDASFVLQFLSATKGEGTSLVAAQFARTASAEQGRSVLLVNCDPRVVTSQRPTLVEALQRHGNIEAAIGPSITAAGLMIAQLTDYAHPLLSIDTAGVRQIFDLAKNRYSIVALDCPATSQFADSLALARHCDGTLLVVRAELAPKRAIKDAIASLDRFGGQVIGMVFNQAHTSRRSWFRRRAAA
jgi:protein-tyrosine kinase